MADFLRLESCQAVRAQNHALLLATPGQPGDTWASEPFHGELRAAVLAPVVGDLEVMLKSRHAHIGVRHQAPGLVLDTLFRIPHKLNAACCAHNMKLMKLIEEMEQKNLREEWEKLTHKQKEAAQFAPQR